MFVAFSHRMSFFYARVGVSIQSHPKQQRISKQVVYEATAANDRRPAGNNGIKAKRQLRGTKSERCLLKNFPVSAKATLLFG